MGNTLAQNEVNSTISSLSESIQKSTTSCRAAINQTNELIIVNSNHIDLNKIHLTGGNYVLFNPQCISSTNQSSIMNNSISATVTEVANAITQNLDLNPGSVEANDIVNQLISLNQVSTNEIINNCITSATQTNSAIIQNANHVNMNGAVIDWNNTVDDISNCIFNSFQSTSLTSQIVSDLNLSATAKVEDSLGVILMALAIVAVIIFMLWIGGTLEIVLIIVIIVAILLIVYLIIAKIKKWWPFTSKGHTGATGCTGSSCATSGTGATGVKGVQDAFMVGIKRRTISVPGKLRNS